MKNILITSLMLLSGLSQAAFIIPSDYDDTQKFIKVSKSENQYRNRTTYTYQECVGNFDSNSCFPIFDIQGYSESELNSLETNAVLKGSALLALEVVTGGIIWKRLARFAIGGANKLVLKTVKKYPRYRGQDVATGIMSLGIGTSSATIGTVAVLETANEVFDVIDPFERFDESELIDTDEYQNSKALIPVDSSYDDTYSKLQSLLSEIK